jgi:hypothetical protein
MRKRFALRQTYKEDITMSRENTVRKERTNNPYLLQFGRG